MLGNFVCSREFFDQIDYFQELVVNEDGDLISHIEDYWYWYGNSIDHYEYGNNMGLKSINVKEI